MNSMKDIKGKLKCIQQGKKLQTFLEICVQPGKCCTKIDKLTSSAIFIIDYSLLFLASKGQWAIS